MKLTVNIEQTASKISAPGFIDALLLNLPFKQKGILLIAVPLLFEILFIILLSFSYAKAEAESRRADHGRRVLAITDAMTSSTFALGASLFVDPSSNFEAYQNRFKALELSLQTLTASLIKETKSYPDESKYTNEITRCLGELQQRANALKEIAQDPLQMISRSEFRKSRVAARQSIHKLAGALDEIITYQGTVSGARLKRAQEARQQLNLLLYAGVAANVGLCIWLALLFSAQITRRIEIVSRNAVLMSRRQHPEEIVLGKDELAELDKLIHQLADMLIESSRRERALVDNTIDVILSLTGDLRVLAVNAASDKQWGWPPESLVSMSVSELILAEHKDSFANSLEAASRNSGEGRHFECSLVRRDGSILESRWSVFWSEREKAYFAIVRDVGEERRLEQMRKQFFSMVTHDLRSPLANMKLFLHMLGEGAYGEINKTGIKRLDNLNNSLEFLTTLTGDLLELSKMQTKGLSLSLQKIAADSLVDDCCAMIETLAESRSVKLKVLLSSSRPIYGDFVRLKQVLANFLSNAIKFSPEGSTIVLKMETVNDMRRVSVLDQGKTLSPEDCKQLFDAFVQADNQKHVPIKGFGLGLSIAKTIIEAHSGKIGVDIEDEGTCFWFEVPELDNLETSRADESET
ncbi:MAG: PAS domain S-box protein [Candidatus Obscuribacterales bacterium]|nr:PAS domain S-box protein [Candidatus Obscuribacterales bacterium]